MFSCCGSSVDENESEGEDFSGDPNSQMPVLFNQGALNDLGRDFDLSKIFAELLASRLSERKMLA